MDSLCDSRIRTRNFGDFIPLLTWSSSPDDFRTTALSPNCSINRYYDSSADSFISVDLAIQRTDQVYVFTNDNPMNATDPLGLCSGFLDCIVSAAKTVVKVITKTVDVTKKAYTTVNNDLNHVVIGFGGCLGICVNVFLQGTTVTLSAGGTGEVDKGLYVGYAHLPINQRKNTDAFIVGGTGIGGSVEVGVGPRGGIDRSDWEADGGQVSGAGGGVMWSKSINFWP